jgi:hypothetical protein
LVESVFFFCVKQFKIGWQRFRWWRRGWNRRTKVFETVVKRLLYWEFRRVGKGMGQVYQCWWRICGGRNIFPRFKYHMFNILYPFVSLDWFSLVKRCGLPLHEIISMKQPTAFYKVFLIYYYHPRTPVTVSYHRYRELITVLKRRQISEQYHLQGYNAV